MNEQELINLINERMTYEPDTGIFRHKASISRNIVCGDIAGTRHKLGYIHLNFSINGKQKMYLAHRVAWLLTYGKWPDGYIDHINRKKDDNRIANLRDVSHEVNMNNVDRVHNARGWSKKGNKYNALIRVKSKQIYLGTFDTPEEAHAVYLKAKEELK